MSVVLVGSDRAALLALVSTLHRRGVDVLEADLSRPAGGRRVFNATIAATPRQASSVEASLGQLIDVVEVVACKAIDARRRAA
ncbi:hypothetical protein [Jiangella endophytica]|uniref:hypothetical protein n=1 Tax=Jiangella endophytica TaxID=1623398 RepID=UPI000E35032C|nr:hypothetical protein [Jiangella endophytica]